MQKTSLVLRKEVYQAVVSIVNSKFLVLVITLILIKPSPFTECDDLLKALLSLKMAKL